MIRIIDAEAVPVTFRLREGYRIAGASFETADNVILKVVTADGRTGFGCAAPAEEVTGESADACRRACRDVLVPLLRGSDAADREGLHARALAALPGAPAARAAVDIALCDLMGQRAGVPLARLLGMRRHRLPTSITLGIGDPDEVLRKAGRHVAEGFRILKVKVGEDWRADARLIHLLRGGFGSGIVLRADANQGYSEEDAGRFLAAVADDDLELLEQPTIATDLAAMERVQRATSVPIMADESVRSPDEARALVRAGAARLVNIKLMKCGGLLAGSEIAGITHAAGMGAMLGCMDESRIGIAAALHLALAAPNAERADLDGHLDLVDDVASGGVRVEAGYVVPDLDRPGLGVSVDL
jgi:L-alanine-DL-glutamate epimerase-like enolase superfamily enzyme